VLNDEPKSHQLKFIRKQAGINISLRISAPNRITNQFSFFYLTSTKTDMKATLR
jgi:hypothetical protein